MTEITRRTVLGGAAATAATAAGPPGLPIAAAAEGQDDLALFVALSAALTGVDVDRLAPDVDPVQVKREYFKRAGANAAAFAALMQIVHETPNDPAAAAGKIMNNADPDIKYLGRSIILMWYLGAWYDPGNLKILAETKNPPFTANAFEVISPKAYTQGWVWRVAQTHPMGYSEWHFGYWHQQPDPPTLQGFIGKSG